MHLSIKKTVTMLLLSATCMVAMAQQTVKGTVTDKQGAPVIGASVIVNGKAVAITDVDGNFTLPSADPSQKIELSYLGYKNQVVSIGNKSQLNIVMEEDSQSLNEVVVVGYGTMRKTDLTGSVGSVDNAKLNEKGAASVLENLQGSVPGVSITKSSGRTGGSMNIEIRGKNSLSGSQSPLYVVDGVICSDIDFLNPQDIDRIDVLKDASSTAIYGSRATAGVVMVTTKSGANVGKGMQKPTISYDGYYGVSKVARMPDFQDAQEFYNYRFMKFLTPINGNYNNGQPIWTNTDIARCLLQIQQSDPTSGYRMKELLAEGNIYDWPDLVLQNGKQQNHYLAISGSTEKVHYHMGLGFQDEEGHFKGDAQDKFTFKGSLDAEINKYVTAGFSVNLARTNHDYASSDAVRYAFRANPYMQPYKEDGTVNKYPGTYSALGTDLYAFTSQISPLVYMDDQTSNTLAWNALANVYLEIKPLKSLSFKTTFSPTFNYSRYGFYQGTEAGEAQNEAQRTTSQGFSWTWDNVLTWNQTFKEDHNVNVMGLVSASYSDGESEKLYFNNVMEGTYWWNLGTSNQGYNYLSSGTGYSETSLLSYALRANYSYKGKYMATATIRWDGSSKFADGNRWGSFPSAAVAWRISEENFMKKLDWLSNLKLRLSYGVTGNNSVGSYATRLVVGGPVYYPFGSVYGNGMYPSGIVDKDLKWEKAHEFNVGLDFGFLNERIRGSIDWYNKKSTDLLYSVNLPLEAGGSSVTTNIGSVRNRGIEVALTTENIVSKDWHWTTSFTFAHNKNEILEVNGTGDYLTGNHSGNLIIGQPYNNVYSYEWNGIVSDRYMTVPDTEIARLKGFTPGEQVKEANYYYQCYGLYEGNPIITDFNGDGQINTQDKRLYKSDPAWTGSFTSNLQWKNWDFSFSVYTKQDYTVFSSFYGEYLNMSDRGRVKLDMDWYIPAGTLIDCDGINTDGTLINPKYQLTTHYGSYPFPNDGNYNGVGSDYWIGSTNAITDASFVKVKHITLGYTLPKTWTTKFGCSHLRLYCTVTNPFVFTDYKGYDPEWAGASNANDGPSTVTWQFGASIKF